MTNGEAVNWIINISADIGKAKHRDLWHYEQALSEIKEMLETSQLEIAKDINVPGNDCISRQAAVVQLSHNKIGDGDCDVVIQNDIETIKALPSEEVFADIIHLQKEQAYMQGYEDGRKSRKGKWRHYESILTCSECGAEFYDDIKEYCGDDVPKFCPNCGIYNGGEEDE